VGPCTTPGGESADGQAAPWARPGGWIQVSVCDLVATNVVERSARVSLSGWEYLETVRRN
jgi:hypothetical protein